MNRSRFALLRALAALCLVGVTLSPRAQTVPATGAAPPPSPASLDAARVQDVARWVPPGNVFSDRLDAVEGQVQRSADEIALLRQMLADQQAMLEINGQILRQLSRSGAAPDAERAALDARREAVQDTIAEADKDVAEGLDAILRDLREHPLEQETDPESAIDRAREVRTRVAESELAVRQKRKDNAKRFAKHCDAPSLAPSAASALEPLVEEPLPAHWTLALVDVAVVHGVPPLPQCLSDAEDGALEGDMRAQIPNEAAVRQTRGYVFDRLAYAVAQIVTFPARVLVKIWQCLWGLPGCEPQGGGGSDGEGGGRGAAPGDDGGTVSHVVADGTPGAVSGSQTQRSDDDDTSGSDRAPGEGGADGDGRGSPREAETEVGDGPGPALRQHANIAPGLDVAVRVNHHLLTFTDLKTEEKWLTEWPPNLDGKVSEPLPQFSEAIHIVSASVANRQLVVEIDSIRCTDEKPGRLHLKLDPEPRVEGEMIVDRVSPDCVW